MTAEEFTQEGYSLASKLDWLVSQSKDAGQLATVSQEAGYLAATFQENADRAQERIGSIL
jgi:hypothetical protein